MVHTAYGVRGTYATLHNNVGQARAVQIEGAQSTRLRIANPTRLYKFYVLVCNVLII